MSSSTLHGAHESRECSPYCQRKVPAGHGSFRPSSQKNPESSTSLQDFRRLDVDEERGEREKEPGTPMLMNTEKLKLYGDVSQDS